MTTGEYLVLNSTLTSGTALQHLLAQQVDSVTFEPLLVSRIYTVYKEPEHTFTKRRRKDPETAQANKVVSSQRPRKVESKSVFVLTQEEGGYVHTHQNTISLVQVKK